MSEAVALSLMPAALLLRLLLDENTSVAGLTASDAIASVVGWSDLASSTADSATFFFFFVLPAVLFKECVRPWSFSLDMRADERSRSAMAMGNIVTIFSGS